MLSLNWNVKRAQWGKWCKWLMNGNKCSLKMSIWFYWNVSLNLSRRIVSRPKNDGIGRQQLIYIEIIVFTANIVDSRQEYFLGMIGQSIGNLSFKYVQVSHKVDSKISVDDLMQFAVTNLLHTHHAIRVACASIINNMAKYFIDKDMDKSGCLESNKDNNTVELHLLHKFSDILHAQDEWTVQYINEFE